MSSAHALAWLRWVCTRCNGVLLLCWAGSPKHTTHETQAVLQCAIASPKLLLLLLTTPTRRRRCIPRAACAATRRRLLLQKPASQQPVAIALHAAEPTQPAQPATQRRLPLLLLGMGHKRPTPAAVKQPAKAAKAASAQRRCRRVES